MTPSTALSHSSAFSKEAPATIHSLHESKKQRHVLSIGDLDDATWRHVIDSAIIYKKAGVPSKPIASGKSLGLVFLNPSLRTRTSMELAAQRLGANVTTLTPGQDAWQLAFGDGVVMDGVEAEHVRDAFAVLSRYVDALGVRVFASGTDHEKDVADVMMKEIADAATVPVINLESAMHHPCQALADAAVMADHFDGKAAGKKFVLTWTHHPKALPMAVPNSALLAAARSGMHVTVARPDSHVLESSVMDTASTLAETHGGSVMESSDMDAAIEGADVVYAKAWGGPMTYTDPEKEASLRTSLSDWRVTAEHMASTRNGRFMHCLPVRRNVVVDDAVLDGPQAMHIDQAEYRLHAQQALLEHVFDC
ncbi:acetylornithine carbamoyltransferase [Longibacter salinarum]|uniref:Acetylornithine carbamoyltransferase n=1 Tax=Longibacter salinarum TaxID=1850348 RepID=A0A2A8D195_9BACT|nr:N-acetylornithine carbamoyltransferase [Longibacter salinarum]PEN14418.1 acetylornithine carbamoyltransferase [Longibacter salinarum]